MASIESKIEEWMRAGIVTSDQAKQLLAYEDSRSSRNWAAYGIAGLGIVVLAIGVISIIAANWDAISASQKLVAYFVFQCLIGLGVLRSISNPGLLRELSITFFALFFLCGIGLIAQIYNIEGVPWGASAFWLILTLPITLLGQSRLINHLWMIGLLITVGLWLTSDGSNTDQIFIQRGLTTVAIAYAVAGIGLFRKQLLSVYFRNAARFWSFSYLALAVTVGTSAWYADNGEKLESLSLATPIITVWLSIAFSIGLIWLSKDAYVRPLRVAIAAMLIASGAYLTLPVMFNIPRGSVVAFLAFELVFATAAVTAALAHRRRLFDLITIVMTLRFLFVYFEVFGSLAATGIGLIVSGLVIVGVALLWNKHRKKVSAWLEAKA